MMRGIFIVVAADSATVHVLTKTQTSLYFDRLRMAADRDQYIGQTHRLTFGLTPVDVIPAWDSGILEIVAEQYNGLHEDTVRWLAAAILLGKPYTMEGREPPVQPPKGSGGKRARLVKPVPVLPAPGGVALEQPR